MTEPVTVSGDTESLRDLVEAGDWPAVHELALALHPADLADVLNDVDAVERARILQDLPADAVGRVLEFVEHHALQAAIESIPPGELPAVLEEVADDVIADVIQQLDPEEQAATLAALDLDRAEEVQELLQHRADTVGGIMTHGFVALQERMSVQQAIDYLRMLRPPSDQVYYLYVVDDLDRLLGTLSIRDVLVTPPGTMLEAITRREIHTVAISDDQEEAARMLKKYDLLAIPAVNDEGRLEGVVTVDDVIDVLEDEATEDMFRMVGIQEGERISSDVRGSIRRRLPWLVLNLVTAFAAAAIVGLFDSTIAKAAVLAVFMPVVAGQGGNAGTQTATIAVRSIAIGDLMPGDVFRAIRKELFVGVINGLVVGFAAALPAYAFTQNLPLSLVLGVALAITVAGATIGGLLIPLGLRARGVDPALASNIFVTTLTDILGFIVFLGIAAIVIDQIA